MIVALRRLARSAAPALLLLLTAAVPFVRQAGDGGHLALASVEGFTSEVVLDNIPQPMDFAFAPDGRIFIATLLGEVRIIENGSLLPTPFYSVFTNSNGERGLVGLALDPAFETNSYVYLYYTHETNISQPSGVKTNRLIRVTANGNVAEPGSEVVLLGSVLGVPATPSCLDYPTGTDCLPADGLSHVGGALRFAPDGTLFVATGDASFLAPSPETMTVHTQDLDWLGGKLLHIDAANGAGLSDNPFFTGDASANRSKVYAYGFRQPFRFSLKPGTSVPFVGEVGSNYWEEIDAVEPGGNYGWPCFEGYLEHPSQSAFAFCQAFYAAEPQVEHPAHAYARPSGGGAAVVGGVFATGSNYPADVSGAYFFSDWIGGAINALRFDNDNNPLPDSLQTVLSGAGSPVDFEVGPDGDVYYLSWPPAPYGELRHLRFVAGNRQPVAKASATPRGGLAVLDVQFSSAGSSDPDGNALSYDWDFDDGGSSTEANPSHAFAANGSYAVSLTVDDGLGGTDSDTVSIIVGNQPPQATIFLPYGRTSYDAWDSIPFSGYGFDPEAGPLGSSALRWSVGLRHCEPVLGGICHTHPFLETDGLAGSVIAPDQGDDLLSLVFELTVTDSVGLTNSASVTIGPDSDGDGLLDYEETLTEGTDRFDPDTDGGGAPDELDAAAGDPLNPGDDAGIMAVDTDGDGCINSQELGPTEELGGRRDPLNPYDFYDTDGNRLIDLFNDIFAVANAFGGDADSEGAGEPDGYDAALDRSPPQVGGDLWDTRAPDGTIDLFTDIFGIAFQFGHSCEAAP